MRTQPLTISSATPARWNDLTAVFGRRGAPPRCWCQYFIDPTWSFDAADTNKAALREQVEQQHPAPGLIAYDGEKPVGWVEVGPRRRYPNSRVPDGDDRTWAITCFVVPPGERRGGIAGELLDAAVAHAEHHGATRILARPIDTEGARKPGSDLYTGVLSTFLRRGFRELDRRGHHVVVELRLGRRLRAVA